MQRRAVVEWLWDQRTLRIGTHRRLRRACIDRALGLIEKEVVERRAGGRRERHQQAATLDRRLVAVLLTGADVVDKAGNLSPVVHAAYGEDVIHDRHVQHAMDAVAVHGVLVLIQVAAEMCVEVRNVGSRGLVVDRASHRSGSKRPRGTA